MIFSSMSNVLIDSQSPFVECMLCNPVNQSQSTQVESEQKSKHSNKPFRFNNLPAVIQHCVGVYLDFLDLTRLASTHNANKDMLKCKSGIHSPYLIAKIQCATILTPESLYSYVRASNVPNGFDFPSFIQNAKVLTHLIAQLRYSLREKKQCPLNEKKLNRILVSCPMIRHLTINFSDIYLSTLDSIAKACPNLQQLTLIGNLEQPREIMTVLNQLKKLEYLALKPQSWLSSNMIVDSLETHEISELIERKVHITLLPEHL